MPDNNIVSCKRMDIEVPNFISQREFRKVYGLWGGDRYMQFVHYVKEKIEDVIDYETSVDDLYIKRSWTDSGRNIHILILGSVSRRDQISECGGEIVWLRRLKRFRGHCWSRLNPKADYEYYEEARRLFYSRKYSDFLSLSIFIAHKYENYRPFRRMCEIARARV